MEEDWTTLNHCQVNFLLVLLILISVSAVKQMSIFFSALKTKNKTSVFELYFIKMSMHLLSIEIVWEIKTFGIKNWYFFYCVEWNKNDIINLQKLQKHKNKFLIFNSTNIILEPNPVFYKLTSITTCWTSNDTNYLLHSFKSFQTNIYKEMI